MTPKGAFADVPGAELVLRGIDDLQHERLTEAALLVSIGSSRLKRAGVDVPCVASAPRSPELALYEALCADGGGSEHSRYNALIRRLVSFEREVERRQVRNHGGEPTGGACEHRRRDAPTTLA